MNLLNDSCSEWMAYNSIQQKGNPIFNDKNINIIN